MVNINIIGRLGADAEVVEGKNGKFVSFRMATDDWKDGKKATTWFRVRFNNDKSGKMIEYLKKGKLVNVFGTESVGTYEAKDGAIQISREINAYNVEFVSVGNGQSNSESSQEESTTVNVGSFKEKEVVVPTTVATEPEDDLPF